jgi:hypothetical protein
MAVEFQLQEHSGQGQGFAAVPNAPGFDTWVHSQPGVGIFTYSHEVTGLPAPASFRVLVRARWLDRRHRVIRRQTIVSPVCVQTVLAPDLSIGAPLTRAAGPEPGIAVYSVPVRNDGTAAASSFQVALSVGGVAATPVTVATLAPSSTQLIQFTAPRCRPGASIVVQADPAGAVSEPADGNRTRTFSCPHQKAG